MDCSLPGNSTGVGCHSLLQEIFSTQGLNPGLLHCRQTLYHLSHQGSSFLKAYTKLHVHQDTEQKKKFVKSLGQTYLLALESLLERKGAGVAHPGDRDTSGSHTQEH